MKWAEYDGTANNPSTNSPAYANIPHNGLLWSGLQQHYPITPGSTNLLDCANRY
ncbi:hypothetical protein K443DRAFT_687010, partial [Laccaria amethystina LaAM-08-1]